MVFWRCFALGARRSALGARRSTLDAAARRMPVSIVLRHVSFVARTVPSCPVVTRMLPYSTTRRPCLSSCPPPPQTMLRSLSGRSHYVHTGVSVYTETGAGIEAPALSFSETTHVHFGELSDEEIDAYVEVSRRAVPKLNVCMGLVGPHPTDSRMTPPLAERRADGQGGKLRYPRPGRPVRGPNRRLLFHRHGVPDEAFFDGALQAAWVRPVRVAQPRGRVARSVCGPQVSVEGPCGSTNVGTSTALRW